MESTSTSTTKKRTTKKARPATSTHSREVDMIELTMDTVEQRIREGKASSAELCHFLKLGTEQAKLEREKIAYENQLLQAKTESIQQQDEVRALFKDAITMMSKYQGKSADDEDEDDLYD